MQERNINMAFCDVSAAARKENTIYIAGKHQPHVVPELATVLVRHIYTTWAQVATPFN